MNEFPSPRPENRRDDIVVSVCITDVAPSAANFSAIATFAKRLDDHYRFREIIVVAEEKNSEAFYPLTEAIPNLRLFALVAGISKYEKRVIGAREAIGDVVLIAGFPELVSLDVTAMIDEAADHGAFVTGRRLNAGRLAKALSLPLIAIGRAAGFRVGLRDMQTIAVPRALLTPIMDHSAPELALRFPPRDPRVPLSFVEAMSDIPSRRGLSGMESRLELLQTLIVYMAPRFLKFVTVSSAFLIILGLGFALYVLGIWFFKSEIAPGWLTTSMMLSLTALFFGISVFGLSIGLQHLLALQRRADFDAIASEINKIDLFGQVASELNVDLDREEQLKGKEREC